MKTGLYAWSDFNIRNVGRPEPGVFCLYNVNKDLIYVGFSNNLLWTLERLWKKNFQGDRRLAATSLFHLEFVGNPKVRQLELLEEYKQKNHGTLPPGQGSSLF